MALRSESELESESESESENSVSERCETCGKKAHDFVREEPMDCVPPRHILRFGNYVINKEYREALYVEFPFYTTEEVVGSYLGYNPHFPSEEKWLEKQEMGEDDSDYDSEDW